MNVVIFASRRMMTAAQIIALGAGFGAAVQLFIDCTTEVVKLITRKI